MNSIFIFKKIFETSDSVRLKLLFSNQQTMKEMLFNLLKQDRDPKVSDEWIKLLKYFLNFQLTMALLINIGEKWKEK